MLYQNLRPPICPGCRVWPSRNATFRLYCEQLLRSGHISCGQRHDEASSCALDAEKGSLSSTCNGFCPAESFFDPFAVPEGEGVALVPDEHGEQFGGAYR